MFGITLSRSKPAALVPATLAADPRDINRNRSAFSKLGRAVRSAVFNAAGQDRLSASWGSTPLTPDQVIQRNQRTLVARSREQCTNNDYGRAFLRMCRQNIIGAQGVILNAQVLNNQGKLDVALNDAIEWAWTEWAKPENCDVKGRQSLRTISNALVNGAAKDGEFMVRMVWGDQAGPWGFALQTLDPQRCPVDMNVESPAGGGFIRHGIHFNVYGRPTAYYFTANTEDQDAFFYGGQAYLKVPAEEIIHGFEEDMVGQKRGLPWMATSLFRMRHLSGTEDATVVNMRIGSSKMGFVQWKEGFGPEYVDENDIPEITAEPGVFETLPEGAELKEWNPQFPAGEFLPFYKTMLRGMAAGMGVPYNELAADLEGVNYSSIRQGTLDSRERWKDLQEWFIESFIARVYAAWLPRALLGGRIKVRGKPVSALKLDKLMAVEWQARRWQWIDPRADVAAAEISKNNMLASPGAIIREQGKDPLTVWKETARDLRAMIDAFKAEGIPEDKATELVMLSMGRQPEKPQPNTTKTEETQNA